MKARALAADPDFPSVALDTLKFLHQRRHILFHGHEPLDTDSTPALEGEAWLMPPLASHDSPLHWNAQLGYRVR